MITVDLRSVCVIILIVFILMMAFITMKFIQALFKFPELRDRVWNGITDGDNVPHLDDFRKTAQLFWSSVFGSGLVCCFLLWAAFPENHLVWVWVTSGVGAIFLACIGLKTITGLFKH